jgi:DNA-binding transcriptional MerR regulator
MEREIEPRFSLDELVDATGVNKRTIRYYIQQGVVPPSAGKGRSAHYTAAHVEAVTRIRDLRDRNLSIDEIRELLDEEATPQHAAQGDVWNRIVLHPALEIHVHGNAPEHVRALVTQVQLLSARWFGEDDS